MGTPPATKSPMKSSKQIPPESKGSMKCPRGTPPAKKCSTKCPKEAPADAKSSTKCLLKKELHTLAKFPKKMSTESPPSANTSAICSKATSPSPNCSSTCPKETPPSDESSSKKVAEETLQVEELLTKCVVKQTSSPSSSTDSNTTSEDDPLSKSFGSYSTTTITTTTTDVKCSTSSSISAAPADDAGNRWRCPVLTMIDLRFIRRLGSGDIGSVYLVEMKGLGATFAAKVMDKRELVRRNKVGRARTEREILEAISHPFLPTLHAVVDSSRWSCLVTEFCPGGDLHVLRQLQPDKKFDEAAVRFYAAEVVAALEYIHMMGIVYRDLKPENVLVRSDGHIMLTDFDLSLRCEAPTSTALVIMDPSPVPKLGAHSPPTSCMLPSCIVPAVSCFHPMRHWKKRSGKKPIADVVAEPAGVRSMSFVGTHEYLAPEIVTADGHGSAVDWWTLGIFVYELLYGVTPFRGADNESTLANIIARALEFPVGDATGCVSNEAREFIALLLNKEPERRLGSTMGAAAVKRHPFFDGVNWALLRCATPPYIPPPSSASDAFDTESNKCSDAAVAYF